MSTMKDPLTVTHATNEPIYTYVRYVLSLSRPMRSMMHRIQTKYVQLQYMS